MIIQEVNKSSRSFLLLRHVLISSEENKFICERDNLSVGTECVCAHMNVSLFIWLWSVECEILKLFILNYFE